MSVRERCKYIYEHETEWNGCATSLQKFHWLDYNDSNVEFGDGNDITVAINVGSAAMQNADSWLDQQQIEIDGR